MPDQDQSRLEQMKRGLYSREHSPEPEIRSRLSPEHQGVQVGWGENNTNDTPMAKKRRISLSNLLLAIAALFFAVSAAVAFYSFSTGQNTISSENIEMGISGPVSLKGGEELTLQLLITNHNSVPLESTDMAILYPADTRDSEDLTKEITRYQRFIGTIKPGETVRETVKATLFGKENEQKDITVLLEYRTEGSNALFEKRKTYSLVITSAPVHISLFVPDEVTAGQEIPLEVTVSSNSTETIKNMYLELKYPEGFVFHTSDIKPAAGTNLWFLGDLTQGVSRVVTINGAFSGNAEETRNVNAVVGLLKNPTDRVISVPYQSAFETVIIKEPFVALDLSIEGVSNNNYVAQAGKKLRADIKFTNTLTTSIRDGEIVVTFSGQGLDRLAVNAPEGFYRSADGTITWRPQNLPELTELSSGGEGHVSFNFGTLQSQTLMASGYINPAININVTFKGTRVSEGFATQEVIATKSTIVKINSQLAVNAKALYSIGSFTNTGPLPPRIDRETTYTIVWSVTNTSNDLRDVNVQATLPTYIKWLGVVSPVGEQITYNQTSGRITWAVGTLPAGTGFSKPAKEIAFQIGLTPSLSQLGEKSQLISSITTNGRDLFTGLNIASVADDLTTELKADPAFKDNQARVVQ